MKIKKNDMVVVLTGKDVKKTGKVLVSIPSENKVVVEGVNIQEVNHKARSAQDTSSKVKKEGPIDASNVLVICPVCGKATRVAHAEKDGKKIRVCKKCGAPLDVKEAPAEVKAAKKAAKAKEVVAEEAVEAAPVKKTRKSTKKVESENA